MLAVVNSLCSTCCTATTDQNLNEMLWFFLAMQHVRDYLLISCPRSTAQPWRRRWHGLHWSATPSVVFFHRSPPPCLWGYLLRHPHLKLELAYYTPVWTPHRMAAFIKDIPVHQEKVSYTAHAYFAGREKLLICTSWTFCLSLSAFCNDRKPDEGRLIGKVNSQPHF